MPGQSASRHDMKPDDLLLAFDSEEREPAVDRKEPEVVFRPKEPDPVFDAKEVDPVFDAKEPTPAFDAKEVDIARLSATPFVMHESVPVVPQTRRWNVGIALLVLGSIGLVWSGRWLMGTLGKAGASAAPAQTSSRPTQDVPQAAPNVLPPAPAPQPPARPDAPSATTTPSRDPAATATVTPPDERRVGQPASRPAVVNPNAPGGLFAITRPVGAQVFLDDKLVGTTPLFLSRLSPGSHQVRLEMPGFKTYSSTIHIERNERFRVALQLEELVR
jgi:PEGA domain